MRDLAVAAWGYQAVLSFIERHGDDAMPRMALALSSIGIHIAAQEPAQELTAQEPAQEPAQELTVQESLQELRESPAPQDFYTPLPAQESRVSQKELPPAFLPKKVSEWKIGIRPRVHCSDEEQIPYFLATFGAACSRLPSRSPQQFGRKPRAGRK